MAPRRETTSAEDDNGAAASPISVVVPIANDEDAPTVIVKPTHGPPYVRCTSKQPFVNPTTPLGETPAEVNENLNLNLGQTLIDPENKTLLWIIRFLNNIIVGWWEHHFFALYKKIPVSWKRSIMLWLWHKLYFPLHKRLLGRRTGIHPDASEEFHAVTTFMWGGRLFPVTVARIRFMLSELGTMSRPPPAAACPPLRRIQDSRHDTRTTTIANTTTTTKAFSHVESIDEPFHSCMDSSDSIPAAQRNHCHVQGLYSHLRSKDQPTEYALVWCYGGAFLAGDAAGNLSHAKRLAESLGMDVFLPTHRLVPEAYLSDAIWDVCLAYRWFCEQRVQQGCDPRKTFLLGVSSGGGLITRLLQTIAECSLGTPTLPDYLPVIMNNKNVPMPAGAVLLGPFADYCEPAGSLVHYPSHDLIVNQRVCDFGFPYLETHCDGGRREHSPVHRSFQGGLPPLCVVTSEHEAVYDHAIDLVNKARAQDVPVTLGVWRFMPHVFALLGALIPEGEDAMDFVREWLLEQKQQHQQSKDDS